MRDRLGLIGVCVDRGGYRRGARVAEFVMEWEVAVRKHAGPVGIEEFARWWRESRMTAYRRLAEFRELFPELGQEATPNDLMRPLLDAIASGVTDWQAWDAIPLEVPT